MSHTSPLLSTAQLATLFGQLRQMESAGLSASQAFALLEESDSNLKAPLALVQRQLKSGRPVSEAGFRAKLFDDTLRALIAAAESSGQLAEIYGQLAEHYTGLAGRIARVKSRMWLPMVVLAIALLVQPLPALVGAEISVGGYLYLSLGRLALLATGVFVLFRLPGMRALWGRIPFVARYVAARQLNEFFFVLAMLLEGGLAFDEALPKAVATISDHALRARFDPALKMLGSGASVTAILGKVPAIDSAMLGVVDSSEQSGKLAGGILQYTRLEAEAIGRQDDALAAWMPRIAYAMVAGWMAYSLLHGNPITNIAPVE